MPNHYEKSGRYGCGYWLRNHAGRRRHTPIIDDGFCRGGKLKSNTTHNYVSRFALRYSTSRFIYWPFRIFCPFFFLSFISLFETSQNRCTIGRRRLFTRQRPSNLRMCVYIEKFISGVTGLFTMLLCYKAGKKIF